MRIDSSHDSALDSEKRPRRRHRVVDEHVDPAVLREGRVDERGDVVRTPDVAAHRDRFAAVSAGPCFPGWPGGGPTIPRTSTTTPATFPAGRPARWGPTREATWLWWRRASSRRRTRSPARPIRLRRFAAASALTRARRPVAAGALDAPIQIRALKRVVNEKHGIESGRSFEDIAKVVERPRPRVEQGKRIAIVGAGPAGLACAHDLALMGHHPVVFDAATVAGGMMRLGIPEYRLPRAQLDREIEFIRWLGVEIRLGTPIGGAVTFQDLMRDFEAVFLAPGCRKGRALKIPGADCRRRADRHRSSRAREPRATDRGRAAGGGGRRRQRRL